MDQGGGALPDHPTLLRELTNTTYTFKNSNFLIQPKELIKKQLGFSPDAADALALTFALPEAPKNSKFEKLINTRIHAKQNQSYTIPF